MEKGVPIRAISRCVSVLQAINRAGDLSLMDIARSAKLPYPTACRIVQTLLMEGLIEREPARKHYRPTALVQSLSQGFQDHSQLVTIARPHIVELTKKVWWPISLATRVGQRMMVRDSTHSLSPRTLTNYYPGYTLPILESAAGKAYLAFAPQEEREVIVREIRDSGDVGDGVVLKMFESGTLTRDVLEAGFAVKGRNQHTETPGKTSSIAVPIFLESRVAGAIVLIFFSSTMKINEAVTRYLDDLKDTARRISDSLDSAASDRLTTMNSYPPRMPTASSPNPLH